ncbi:MAG: nucleotidyltransferase family protein [Chloroflexota bacterium]|nr:nucleotidyltransferase family protein [Chloroflexota bacterium]
MTVADLSDLCIAPDRSIRQAIACIDRNEKGIVLVINEERRLLGTISDGDVRRAMLADDSLDTPISKLLARKADSPYPEPVTARDGTAHAALLKLMQERVVRQVPLLDDDGHVAGLVTLDELLPDQVLPLQAVIMAGGLGTRLRPLTEDLPKPMLPVGDRPLVELIVEQLRHAGIRRVNITTHYMAEKIVEHFGDGHDFGVELKYVTEKQPLGTAGALGLMETPNEPLLVINGDILTRVDFRAMLAYHQEHEVDLTIAVRKYDLNVPYGVIESDGAFVRGLVEKPLLSFFVNAGIYLLEPSVHRYIPNGQCFDMTDLIQRLLDNNRPVARFPVLEYWLDIGHHTDYVQAQKDVKDGRFGT